MGLELPSPKSFTINPFDTDTAIAQGDGTWGFVVPSWMNGWVLSELVATITGDEVGAGTQPTLIQVAKRQVSTGTRVDMLTDKLNIDAGERSSVTAATAYTIDPDNAAIATGDLVGLVDLDQVPETTTPEGLGVCFTFS